ncbi:GyrI-like domain-containing protein [Chitinibacter tainanensis]|uniref:GyrI-like domain-containing protein n=1 Tax=Chitinibacter tainanensis TaxID=230667 RepID=UPI00040BFE66|nr:GyrI-like domain-containing protein [Chitinibacter tainanensis]
MDHVRLVDFPGALLHGIDLITTRREGRCFRDIPRAWQRAIDNGSLIGLPHRVSSPLPLFGVVHDVSCVAEQFHYLLGAEVSAQAPAAPAGYRALQLPAGRYAVWQTEPPTEAGELTSAIMAGWEGLTAWLPSQQLQRAAGPDFEFYDARFDTAGTLELWLPVEPLLS